MPEPDRLTREEAADVQRRSVRHQDVDPGERVALGSVTVLWDWFEIGQWIFPYSLSARC